MGRFNMADALTGLTLARGEPAVALVLARRSVDPAQLDTTVASRTTRSNGFFMPMSLPIHGDAADYGSFSPTEGDLGARLACEMTGCPDWDEFERRGMDVRGKGLAVLNPNGDIDGAETRLFGMAVFSVRSWETLMRVSFRQEDREADLAGMRLILDDALRTLATPSAERTGRQVHRALQALSLRGVDGYVLCDGTQVEIPEVSRVLGPGHFGPVFHDDFAEWLRDTSGLLAYDGPHARQSLSPDGVEMLEGLCSANAAVTALGFLGRSLMPSMGGGQDLNAELVSDLAADTLAQAGDLLSQETYKYDSDESLEGLGRIVQRVEALHASLAERHAKAKAHRDALDAYEVEEAGGLQP